MTEQKQIKWHWDEHWDALVDENGDCVLRHLSGGIEVSESHKKLIAAAPKLLSALEDALEAIQDLMELGYLDLPKDGSSEEKLLNDMDNAIREAGGGQKDGK